ncbi:GNAT family N-acetyltransferase [Actinomadura sp. HBU206391]|uniref:GNAT family N-acetyltransferase n=1 Tax=Actinomadura sp. HBU206391 TaxID=2731692 RepID=UPI00164FE365|nr:GNAT family N-acetyltransferase [Actinomadura sp. HBU206391]MBC6461610.1 GNAT family N-acetyltransferase [Actinomadura sp. HBU206391]
MADVGVRPARREDADAIARVQVRAWLASYQEIVPTAALAELTGPQAMETWRERWAEAVTAPPSPRHRLLVAVEEDVVTGFAAHAPAEDPDHDPATSAELVTLLVDPDHGRAGHGSRLLAATVDLLREDDFTILLTWVFEADEPLRGFFVSAGWAPDGALRTLDMGAPVNMIRMHTDISPG